MFIHPSEILSLHRYNELGSLWTQLFLQFLTDHFETLQVFLSWSEDVHVVFGLSSHYFLSTFPTFFTYFFPGQIIIRIDTMWAQLLLEFSTDHFETMHTCFTWSVDVHMVLELSSHYFLSTFFRFLDLVFPGPINIRIGNLWAQLLLDFSTDHLETKCTCSTWSEDVHVVLELSCHYLFFNFLHFFNLVFSVVTRWCG